MGSIADRFAQADGTAGNNMNGVYVQVFVRDNDVDQALKILKKKMQREGGIREMKLCRAYEKPSERLRGKKPNEKV